MVKVPPSIHTMPEWSPPPANSAGAAQGPALVPATADPLIAPAIDTT
jgi:hypothetical protein